MVSASLAPSTRDHAAVRCLHSGPKSVPQRGAAQGVPGASSCLATCSKEQW
jgi:hypothetical protein